MTGEIEKKLESLGFTLPAAVTPVANYVPFTVSGGVVHISGQLPMKDGKPHSVGKLGAGVSIEDGQYAAKLCGLNILAQLKAACGGDLRKVKKCLRLGVFVNSSADFTDQPKVANGVSDLIVEVFGDAGKHARAAVGVAQLPFGVSVEVDAMFEVTA